MLSTELPSPQQQCPRSRAFSIGRSSRATTALTANAAVTLFELIVVIAIIAILTATLVPQFQGTFVDVRLHGSARELINILQLASDQSVASGQVHRVQFVPQEGRYWIEWIPPELAPGQAPEQGQGFVRRRDFGFGARAGEDDGLVPEPVTLEVRCGEIEGGWQLFGATPPLSTDSVSFFPDGRAQSCSVRLTDSYGDTLDLFVDPFTSRVRVRDKEELR